MDISIRQGETLSLAVTIDDDSAQTLQLLVEDSDGNIVINESTSFATVDGVTSATIQTNNTDLDIGDYSYMFVVTYSDDVIEKLPNVAECDDCDLPKLTICKSINPAVS